MGIMVPMVESKDQAEMIAQSLKEKVAIPIEHPAIYFKSTIKVEGVLEMLNSFYNSNGLILQC